MFVYLTERYVKMICYVIVGHLLLNILTTKEFKVAVIFSFAFKNTISLLICLKNLSRRLTTQIFKTTNHNNLQHYPIRLKIVNSGQVFTIKRSPQHFKSAHTIFRNY